jgi:hypothetical protein
VDNQTCSAILKRAQEARNELAKKAAGEPLDFSDAVQSANSAGLRSEALGDIRNLFLTSLGAGLVGRGGVGLVNTLMRNRQRKQKTGPTLLSMPYPAEPKIANWLTDGLAGDSASTKGGIPFYYPGMTAAGLAGIGLGWKGLDAVLEKRRKSEREQELGQARQQFHDALMSQYTQPVKTPGALINKSAAEQTTMTKVGSALDKVWEKCSQALDTVTSKEAFDIPNALGASAGAYGAYAGLTGLMSGAFIYDKMKKRSRGAILDKAMQRRRRREFMQRPTEIFATPEPTMQGQEALEPQPGIMGQ